MRFVRIRITLQLNWISRHPNERQCLLIRSNRKHEHISSTESKDLVALVSVITCLVHLLFTFRSRLYCAVDIDCVCMCVQLVVSAPQWNICRKNLLTFLFISFNKINCQVIQSKLDCCLLCLCQKNILILLIGVV